MSQQLEALEALENVLQELLSEANTALAVLDKIASTCPSVLKKELYRDKTRYVFYLFFEDSYDKDIFAVFDVDDEGRVVAYQWGSEWVRYLKVRSNPAGVLATLLAEEKKRVAKVARLADVLSGAKK